MNYTSKVKEELTKKVNKPAHCRIAQIAAMFSMCGSIMIDENEKYSLKIKTETEYTAKSFKELIWKTFKINGEQVVQSYKTNSKAKVYNVFVRKHEDALKILSATKIINKDGDLEDNIDIKDNTIIKKDCCKRAFIRGAFLATGSISDPQKSYHLEIKCTSEKRAIQLINILKNFNIDAKKVARKGSFVVYIKEGDQIIDTLNVMEATVSLLDMENIRILKDMSNYYNREVNCEIANIKKTVTTACRQIDDINLIIEKKGIDYLPERLRDIALVRLNNPDASLQKLGEILNPPLGKSGVNHRLRKISEIAQELK